MKKTIAIALSLVLMIAISGCSDSKSRSKGVYMLLDTSGTYALELNKAQSILNYLLGVLQPGDTLQWPGSIPVASAKKTLSPRLPLTNGPLTPITKSANFSRKSIPLSPP